ncbi:hypothetical protein [Frankia umida]|uniref:hypothetical protein n=1 Tax=Frankia umida TaxID=573489 RepID=UPI002010AE39|nr:hypothetical protein [Frankia umida]
MGREGPSLAARPHGPGPVTERPLLVWHFNADTIAVDEAADVIDALKQAAAEEPRSRGAGKGAAGRDKSGRTSTAAPGEPNSDASGADAVRA